MPAPRVHSLAIITLFIIILIPTLAACGGATSSGSSGGQRPVKVGLVTDVGGLNDNGFNHLTYVALRKAITTLGIRGSVVESHSGDDYEPNLTEFAAQGYDLVIGVGFLMQQTIGTVSAEFPNTHFAIVDGTPTDANGNLVQRRNVASILFREQDAGAIVGLIAGMLEKSGQTKVRANTISAVGGVSIPPVNRYIAGYLWGAKREDSSIKTLIGYSNDFSDPSKCAGVAKGQMAAGADIVFAVAGGCGLGALQAAGQRGVYSIGVDTDQKGADPSVIASAVKRVDVAVYTIIEDVINNRFPAGQDYFGLDNNGVGYAPGNLPLSPAIQAEVTKVEGQIKSGSVTVPDKL
jgi:basic membrane protein A